MTKCILSLFLLLFSSFVCADKLFEISGDDETQKILAWLDNKAQKGSLLFQNEKVVKGSFKINYYSKRIYSDGRRYTFVNIYLSCPFPLEDEQEFKVIALDIVIDKDGEIDSILEIIGKPSEEQSANKCVK